MWFTEIGSNKIAKITTSGAISEYVVPAGSKPYGIVTGRRQATSGTRTRPATSSARSSSLKSPNTDCRQVAEPFTIAGGPEGKLWFTNKGTNKLREDHHKR